MALCAAMPTLVCAAAAGTPAALVRPYREAPSPARRTALERYAALHPRDNNGALARLALGIAAYEQKDWPAAAAALRAAQPRLPKLADYISYYLAAARVQAQDGAIAARDLAPVRSAAVPSPFAAQADVLEGRALTAAGAAAEAVRLLRAKYAALPQPDGGLALAAAYQAAGNPAQAAAYYQQVYYGYPFGEAAVSAARALAVLRDTMAASYPQPSGSLLLSRADKILEAREYIRARGEYRALVPRLEGLAREQARVRAGAADLLGGNAAVAYRYLRELPVTVPEADAERLYYLVECARRLDDDGEMLAAVKRLGAEYAGSPWRLKALVSAGNRYLVANRADGYLPLYTAAYTEFPAEPAAALCHWKVAWNAYINRRADAAGRLRRHLELYPSHSTAASAVYFLGRLAERGGRPGEARACYLRLTEHYTGYYYGLLARDRLKESRLEDATPDASTIAFLKAAKLPERPPGSAPSSAATRLRVERARLLRSAGLDDLAAAELRFGVTKGGQAIPLGVELARGGESAFEKLRLVKSLRLDYLALPVEEAPAPFWESLFPLPWRADLVRHAQARKLDPFTVAALIRQESEFNPQAVSRANAYGLTQVLPSTGRQLAHKLGVRNFKPRMLFEPAVNLKLGTFYMRSLLDAWGGRWEETLAAYNAGPSRAREWAAWYRYEEPAEFVETIPFTETRQYVQAVLRNAGMYRRIYQERPVEMAEEPPVKPAPPARPAARKSRQKHG